MRFTKNFIIVETKNGPLSIPCKIANAISSSSNGLTCMSCRDCNGDIGMSYYCKSCNKGREGDILSKSDTNTAIRVDKENKIPLTDELKDSISVSDKVIEVLGSITDQEVDQDRILGSFAVIPDDKTPSQIQKLFTRLQVGLVNSNSSFIVRFNTSSKQKLGILRAENNILVILNYAFSSDYTKHDQDSNIQLTDEELKVAIDFVNKIKPLDIDSITDIRREKITQIIESGEVISVEPTELVPDVDPFASDPVEVIADKLKDEAKADKKPSVKRGKKV